MKGSVAEGNWMPVRTSRPVAGDRVRVAHGVYGRLGWVSSTSPGSVLVRYDDGAREVVEHTRRAVWVVH